MKTHILFKTLWFAGAKKFAISQVRTFWAMKHDVKLVFLRKSGSGDVYNGLLRNINVFVLSENNRSPFAPLYDYITGIFIQSRRGEGRVDYNLIRKFPSFARSRKYDMIICQDQLAGLAGYYNWRKFGTDYVIIILERLNDFPWVKRGKRFPVNIALDYKRKVLLKAKSVIPLTLKVARSIELFHLERYLKCIDMFHKLEERKFKGYGERIP